MVCTIDLATSLNHLVDHHIHDNDCLDKKRHLCLRRIGKLRDVANGILYLIVAMSLKRLLFAANFCVRQ